MRSVLRIFQPGIIAALCQLVIAVTVTALIWLLDQQGVLNPPLPANAGSDVLWSTAAPFLRWAYVLTAIGVACTNTRFVAAAAVRIRQVSEQMSGASRTLLRQR
jgi:hypothetical protein